MGRLICIRRIGNSWIGDIDLIKGARKGDRFGVAQFNGHPGITTIQSDRSSLAYWYNGKEGGWIRIEISQWFICDANCGVVYVTANWWSTTCTTTFENSDRLPIEQSKMASATGQDSSTGRIHSASSWQYLLDQTLDCLGLYSLKWQIVTSTNRRERLWFAQVTIWNYSYIIMAITK